MRAANAKSARGRRWSILMVRWALALYSRSPSAYRHLGKILALPDLGTLRNASLANRGYSV